MNDETGTITSGRISSTEKGTICDQSTKIVTGTVRYSNPVVALQEAYSPTGGSWQARTRWLRDPICSALESVSGASYPRKTPTFQPRKRKEIVGRLAWFP
jgi:hypothetical protein